MPEASRHICVTHLFTISIDSTVVESHRHVTSLETGSRGNTWGAGHWIAHLRGACHETSTHSKPARAHQEGRLVEAGLTWVPLHLSAPQAPELSCVCLQEQGTVGALR